MHLISPRTASHLYRAALGAALMFSLLLVGAASARAATAQPSSGPTTISVASGPFGPYLVVGSGKYAGYTVYLLTSDAPPSYGCTTTTVQLPPGPIACTGPENSQAAEWPAVITVGAPVAGKGVRPHLLSSVYRADIGADQVTYAGHPLYLFEDSPFSITGEDFDEPGLPPWHGVWYLVSPDGKELPWTGTLTSATIQGKTVLVTQMETLAGWINFPVYQGTKSQCIGTCAQTWLPVLTSGTPGVSGAVKSTSVGSRTLSGGLRQVTYKGNPLYLYSDETPTTTDQHFLTVGTGNGKKTGTDTFHLVRP
jgi:predicted lipoprotein with Yx(FWY)xxD motif